jgi:hypothetical protein
MQSNNIHIYADNIYRDENNMISVNLVDKNGNEYSLTIDTTFLGPMCTKARMSGNMKSRALNGAVVVKYNPTPRQLESLRKIQRLVTEIRIKIAEPGQYCYMDIGEGLSEARIIACKRSGNSIKVKALHTGRWHCVQGTNRCWTA